MNKTFIAIAVTAALGAGVASGQDFPNKPIRILTSPVGSSVDFVARVIAQGLAVHLGQPVIVENLAARVALGINLSKAPPDGYTLLIAGGSFWIGPLLQKTPWDPVKDFLPISMMAKTTNILMVHPSLPVKSVKELIALAKARPGELSFARGGTGGSSHLAGELFTAMAGVKIVGIAYTSGAQEIADLLSGRVQLTFGSSALVPHAKSGKLRALAVTTKEPSPLAPGLPTVAASGLPGFEAESQTGLLTTDKTPAPIINRLSQEVVRVLHMPDVKEKLLNSGTEPVGSSPEELAALIKSEMAKWGKVIKDAGITVN